MMMIMNKKKYPHQIIVFELVLLLVCCLRVTMHVSMRVPIVAIYDGFFLSVFYHIA